MELQIPISFVLGPPAMEARPYQRSSISHPVGLSSYPTCGAGLDPTTACVLHPTVVFKPPHIGGLSLDPVTSRLYVGEPQVETFTGLQ